MPTAERSLGRRVLALLLALLGCSAAPLVAQARGADEAERARNARLEWRGPLDESQRVLAAILRAARKGSEPAAGLLERLAAPGTDAIAPLLDILVEERIPRAAAQDAPQLLSVPQRELLLAALSRMPSGCLRAELLRRLGPSVGETEPALRLAALRVFSVIGTGADLPYLAGLAPRDAGELAPAVGEALRAAYAASLRRDPALLERRSALLWGLDAPAARQLLSALGDLRDPRALPLLDECARSLPEHAQQAVALVARIGASGNPDLDQPLSDWLAERLDGDRPEWSRAALRAIGVLDDGRAVPALIGQLESAHPGLREAALGALRQISGLKLRDSAAAWSEWYAGALAWQERGRPEAQRALESGKDALVARALRSYAEQRLFREQLAEDVLPLLERGMPATRVLACETLAQLRAGRALEPLLQHFSDETAVVAEAAWRAACVLSGRALARDASEAREQLARR